MASVLYITLPVLSGFQSLVPKVMVSPLQRPVKISCEVLKMKIPGPLEKILHF